jgi:hypothetical protein
MAGGEEKPRGGEKVKKLAELKETLERRIAETRSELEKLETLLEFVNQTLLEKGFKRADVGKTITTSQTPALPPVVEYETAIPLKTATGSLLANLYMSRDAMRVVAAEDKVFNVKTPPFQQFLIERVLNTMLEKDKEAVSSGTLSEEKVLSYELVLDGDVLREVEIRNLTADRLRELRSSIHWTLEKMHEKTKKSA